MCSEFLDICSLELLEIVFSTQMPERLFDDFMHTLWRIQEFQNRGARSRRGKILKVWGLFWCSFTQTLYVFVMRSSRDYDTHLHIACWVQFKYMHVMHLQFTKTTPPKNQAGRGVGAWLAWFPRPSDVKACRPCTHCRMDSYMEECIRQWVPGLRSRS